MLKNGICVGRMKFNSSDTTKLNRSKVKITRSNKICEKIIKYVPHMSADTGNISVLQETEVAGANGKVRFLTGSS